MADIPPPLARPLWRRKRTYLWLLAGFGLLHGCLFSYGLSHPPTQAGLQLFIGFTLNVALLGWCYIDAEERTVAISGLLGFLLLFIAWIGVPWYFIRSRGWIGALKAAFGLGLFGIWFTGLLIAGAVCEVVLIVLAQPAQ
jgi:hypothetical protein